MLITFHHVPALYDFWVVRVSSARHPLRRLADLHDELLTMSSFLMRVSSYRHPPLLDVCLFYYYHFCSVDSRKDFNALPNNNILWPVTLRMLLFCSTLLFIVVVLSFTVRMF